MTKAKLPVRIGNEISVDAYVVDIQTELTKSTNAWKRIAEILAAAQDQFGRKSKAMKELAKKTGFGEAKVDKLVKIAKSARLKADENLFRNIETWTVLYDVTLLNDEQFETLKGKINQGNTLTSRLVTSVRKPKTENTNGSFQNLATIQMDINAIRSGSADREDYEKLISTLQKLAERVPFIKISMNDLLTKDIDRQQKELMREYNCAVRKSFIGEREKFLNRLKSKYDATYYKKRKKEVLETTTSFLLDQDYSAAYEYIESDQFDQGRLMNEANQKMWMRREKKFGDRVSDPYSNSNLIILPQAA